MLQMAKMEVPMMTEGKKKRKTRFDNSDSESDDEDDVQVGVVQHEFP